MGLAVSVVAPSRRLTRVELLAAELGQAFTPTESAVIRDLIDAATSAIEGYCRVSTFARESVVETLPGFGEVHIELDRRPVLTVSSLSIDSDVVTDFVIDDADAGRLFRSEGFAWTAQVHRGLTGRQRWPRMGQPIPGTEEPTISATYIGGYLLPDLWTIDGQVSAAAADQSFNGSGFPSQLRPGDLVIASKFSNAANNGRFVVASATSSKITVSGAALVDEGAGARDLRFDAPANCRSFAGLERAARLAVKAAWLSRIDDPRLIERQVGSLRTRKREGFGEDPTLAIPGEAVGFLMPWVRSE